MENLSYQRYIADPSLRAAIDAEACRLRHEAVDRYIVRPVKAALKRGWHLARRTRKAAPALSRAAVVEATIAKRHTRRFEDATGFVIRVDWGCVWITQHCDSADYVLNAGETFRITRDGPTLVHALTTASVHAEYVPAISPPGLAFGDAVRALAAALDRRGFGEWLRGIPVRITQASRQPPRLGEPA